MTTIRLKFRPSTVTGHPGTIYYQLYHKQMTKRINTRIRIFPHQWDPEAGHILSGTPENRVLEEVRRKIYRDMRMLENIASGMEASGKEFSLNELAERFKSVHSDVHTRSYVEEDIASLTCNMKLGTANNRRKALSSFLSFLGHKDIPLTEWSGSLFSEYAAWLSRRKVAPNTVSFYMRTLRSVYNKAVREGLVEQNHPFRNVYTGIDKTRKRAVSENIVLRMMQLDLSRSRPLELTRDLFVFSYCTRGMAFVDIAMLRHMDIRGDCILYARKKTGQIMRVRIEPCTKSILDKYSRLHPDSPYVFPLIKSEDNKDIYRQYQTALGYYNRKLKRLGRMLGLDTPLTSYTARHTWATSARDHNTPIAVISSGMGHTSERTTQIYLAGISDSIIDRFNHHILDPLNRAVKNM